MPMTRAAPAERSKVMPSVNGPRSFTRTMTLLPVRGLPTTRQVPKGRDLWAAVSPSGLNTSPDAVRLPRNSLPYHVAVTISLLPGLGAGNADASCGCFLIDTVEHDDEVAESGYRLNPHGRYSHSRDYLHRALDATGFVAVTLDSAVLRMESGSPVAGLVATCRKPAQTRG